MTRDVLIVGAGMAGVMAGRTLSERGYAVTLVERGRSVGGRMATRRVGAAGLADHGAQFFTVRSDTLQTYVDQWLAEELIYVWGRGWSDGSVKRTFGDGYPRYAVRGGMNSLVKHLAQGLDVVLNRLVARVEARDGAWLMWDSDGGSYRGRALLLTPPMPETLGLLSSSSVRLHPEDDDQLRRIQFGPCLCGIHEVEGEVDFPEPGAVQNFQSDIYWVADNQAKGISKPRGGSQKDDRAGGKDQIVEATEVGGIKGKRTIITSHANAKFSRQNWDASEADIVLELESAVRPYLKPGARIVNTQLKKWRYSVPLTTHAHEYMLARELPHLAFAGDAFGGRGRVEGALVSGLAAGAALADALGKG